jgi:hypothetical protein
LLARACTTSPIEERYFFSAVSHYTWHGSACGTDSHIPFILAQRDGSGERLRTLMRKTGGEIPSGMALTPLVRALIGRWPFCLLQRRQTPTQATLIGSLCPALSLALVIGGSLENGFSFCQRVKGDGRPIRQKGSCLRLHDHNSVGNCFVFTAKSGMRLARVEMPRCQFWAEATRAPQFCNSSTQVILSENWLVRRLLVLLCEGWCGEP